MNLPDNAELTRVHDDAMDRIRDVLIEMQDGTADIYRAKIDALTAERDAMAEAIGRALTDSESGAGGWGPDVTVCSYLRASLPKGPR